MRWLSVRILMVENHATFAATVTGEFLHELHVVRTGSVLEALDLFRSTQFDVALVDFDLDDVKGDIFIRRVREMRSSFPIVAISARDDGNAVLVEAGADAVCSKGDFRRIMEAISAAIQQYA